MVLAVVDDLLFSSKIRAVAGAAGETVVFVRSAKDVLAACEQHQPRLILIDLDREVLKPVETISAICTAFAVSANKPQIVGFGAHVNVDRLRAAREAGADHALARSAFVAALPGLLAPASVDSSDR